MPSNGLCFEYAESAPRRSAFYAILQRILAIPLRCLGDSSDRTARTSAFYIFLGRCGIAIRALLCWLCMCYDNGSVVVDSLMIVTPIVGFCYCSMFCFALLCVHSSFAIISMGKRELVALLCLSSWCLKIVLWLFLTMPWVCL